MAIPPGGWVTADGKPLPRILVEYLENAEKLPSHQTLVYREPVSHDDHGGFHWPKLPWPWYLCVPLFLGGTIVLIISGLVQSGNVLFAVELVILGLVLTSFVLHQIFKPKSAKFWFGLAFVVFGIAFIVFAFILWLLALGDAHMGTGTITFFMAIGAFISVALFSSKFESGGH